MWDEDDLCPNFYLGYETEPIFSRPILRLRNYSHQSPYLRQDKSIQFPFYWDQQVVERFPTERN